jgi:hypothetical protein
MKRLKTSHFILLLIITLAALGGYVLRDQSYEYIEISGFGKFRPIVIDSVMEFDKGELNGVVLGSETNLFSKFGIPSNQNFPLIDEYLYLSSGFEYSVEGKKILGFACAFNDHWNLGHSSCNLDLIHENIGYRVTKNTTRDEILKILGEPVSFEMQGPLTITYYVFDGFYYEIDFLESGQLSYIHAYLTE